MTPQDEIEHYKSEIERLDKEIQEQGRYKKLKAQGMFGSESQFADISSLISARREAKQHLMTLQGL